jgi:hypothetical protein
MFLIRYALYPQQRVHESSEMQIYGVGSELRKHLGRALGSGIDILGVGASCQICQDTQRGQTLQIGASHTKSRQVACHLPDADRIIGS